MDDISSLFLVTYAFAQLHIASFANISTNDYGAVAYLKTSYVVSIVYGVYSQTIFRIELMAAIQAERMFTLLQDECNLETERYVLYTDFTVVLGSINNTSCGTLVSKRRRKRHKLNYTVRYFQFQITGSSGRSIEYILR